MNGALLINKQEGISSFGVIEQLQRALMRKLGVRKSALPKMGHGGTLDPFATGLLIVCIGRGVKLARYFLGSTKHYEATIRFGETTVPGDPTAEIVERSDVLPVSAEQLQKLADEFITRDYFQTPPMHSAKKKDGTPLYELARQGIEVERAPKLCRLYSFQILSYEKPRARIRVSCSAGTYIRTLAQDFARSMGSVGMLDTLHRTGSGIFSLEHAQTLSEIEEAINAGRELSGLPCWVEFDHLLDGYPRALATEDEKLAIIQGRQNVLPVILERTEQPRHRSGPNEDCTVIYSHDHILAVARLGETGWGLERVFT